MLTKTETEEQAERWSLAARGSETQTRDQNVNNLSHSIQFPTWEQCRRLGAGKQQTVTTIIKLTRRKHK